MPSSSVSSASLVRPPYVSAQAQLREQALRYVSDYPDVHGLAWATARQLLKELTGKPLNPDKVWWHRFDRAASSSSTFTGWRHLGTPIESMTLVELLMRRFNAHDQVATDELQLYGGFYTEGPHYGAFDERNEVALLPQRLLDRFWALDFAGVFRQRVEHFWAEHGQDFCELARVRCLAAAGLAVRRGDLSLDDVRVLALAAFPVEGLGNVIAPQGMPGPGQISVRSFDIGGHESAQILRVVDTHGRQIVYAPGLPRPFKVCHTERDLYEWVRGQLATDSSRKAFEALFVVAPEATEERAQALAAVLDELRDHVFAADHNLVDPQALQRLNQNERVIAGNVFEHLRDLARQEMDRTADALTSNASLRKQMWIGYLGTFIRITGPFAVFAWPLALAVTGAGIANVVLNVDQALHGRTARQRKAGVLGAILNSIFVLFNTPLLVDAAAGLRAAAPELPSVGGVGENPGEEWIPMQPLSHERLLSGAVPMQGIERTAAGETWIMLDGQPQAVRFSASLNVWLAVDPANPYAFFQASPVRFGPEGLWERLPELRLKGGSPMDGASAGTGAGDGAVAGPSAPLAGSSGAEPLPSVQSEFWDTYMRLDWNDEERLSELALARQKAAIQIRQVQPGDDIEVDTENDEVLVDAWNNEYRVFRTEEGRYVGGRITRYTESEEEFNQYLRTGVVEINNQVDMIEELVEDLEQVGHDNQVSLYRGGSGARGTSGVTFRHGHIRAGDVLVNTDFTSFSENPYLARSFASSQAGAQSYGYSRPITFDDTSIVFELPAGQYLSATPVAPFSLEDEEAESLFMPGNYFEVQGIHEVTGANYQFVRVQIREIPAAPAGGRLYEMRTGLPFSREMYASRLGPLGQRLVDRFFPLPAPQAGQP